MILDTLHHKLIDIGGGLLIQDNRLEYLADSSIVSVTIPDGVNSIGQYAYEYAASLMEF